MKAFVFSSNSIEDGCFNIILSSKLICIQDIRSGIVNIYQLDQKELIVHRSRFKLRNIQQLQIKDNFLYFLQVEGQLSRYNLDDQSMTMILENSEGFKIVRNRIMVVQEGRLKEVDQNGKVQQSIKIRVESKVGYEKVELEGMDGDDKYSITVCNKGQVYLLKPNSRQIMKVEVDDFSIQQYKVDKLNNRNVWVVQLDQTYIVYIEQNRVRIEQI